MDVFIAWVVRPAHNLYKNKQSRRINLIYRVVQVQVT